MQTAVVGGLLACALGVLLAFGNDRLTRAVCKRKPSLLMPLFVVRQVINIAYLAALYFLSPALPWNVTPLLIGGALGITLPPVFLAPRLAKQLDGDDKTAAPPEDTASDGKE